MACYEHLTELILSRMRRQLDYWTSGVNERKDRMRSPDSALDPKLEQFIQLMPKIELHVHLEGAIRPTTLLDLARRHGVELPANDERGITEWYRFRDFPHFVDIWMVINSCLRDGSDMARITRELGESAAGQNTHYLQVSFVPSTHFRFQGVPYDEVWDGIREGANWAEQTLGVKMEFVTDFPRNLRMGDDGSVEATTDWSVAHKDEGIVALGLGGYEVGNPPELFSEVFAHAKAKGLRSWPHAGETEGPASIWGAINALGADRLAHGIRAVEDPALVAHLAEHQIGCDVCPTSNVRLGVYPSMSDHPIRQLIEAGVPVTINSDDPPMFNTSLTDEFRAMAGVHGFSPAELATLVRTGVEVSFLDEQGKLELSRKVEQGLASAASQTGIDLQPNG